MGGYLINKRPFPGMNRTQALCSPMQAVTQVPRKLIRKLPSASFVWVCSGEEVDPTCVFYSHILSPQRDIFAHIQEHGSHLTE